MVKEFNNFPTVDVIKAISKRERDMGKVGWFTPMAIFTPEAGRMMREMVRGL